MNKNDEIREMQNLTLELVQEHINAINNKTSTNFRDPEYYKPTRKNEQKPDDSYSDFEKWIDTEIVKETDKERENRKKRLKAFLVSKSPRKFSLVSIENDVDILSPTDTVYDGILNSLINCFDKNDLEIEFINNTPNDYMEEIYSGIVLALKVF